MADIKQTVGSIELLSQEQILGLFQVLKKNEGLFEGKSGQWNGKNVLIKLKQDALSFYGKFYPFPRKQLKSQRMKCTISAKLEHFRN